ncbi:MAG: tagaturonate epimerase family protein [Bacteroidota bacterium]
MIKKYSFGIGDRFAHQGKYQLQAFVEAQQLGLDISPVWNKSYREHKTVHSLHRSVRVEADQAVQALDWKEPYFVDADHITINTVDPFIPYSDFFTIDIAEQINSPLSLQEKSEFLKKYQEYIGLLKVPGLSLELIITTDELLGIADKFYKATQTASCVYNTIKKQKASEYFVVEVSLDEVDTPQSPIELFFILRMLADQGVPVNTIAPKFSGNFYLGLDYEGEIGLFKKEFEDDLMVIKYAIKEFGLPKDLKLSIHTGSDKYSLYPIINQLIKKHDAGLHVKTAGTTWLEELIWACLGNSYEFF